MKHRMMTVVAECWCLYGCYIDPANQVEYHLEQYHTKPGIRAEVTDLQYWPVSARAADSIRSKKASDLALFYARLKRINSEYEPGSPVSMYTQYSNKVDSLEWIADSLQMVIQQTPSGLSFLMCKYVVRTTGEQQTVDTTNAILNQNREVVFAGF